MTANACLQIGFYLTVLLLLVKPLGWYMSQVLQGRNCGLSRWIGPIERSIYRCAGVDPQSEMNWKTYALAMLVLNGLGIVCVYAVLRWQGDLPLNPQGVAGCTPDLAFNTAISFATNTNWQSYGGEVSLSYFSQTVALTVQNFISAASGIAVLAALIRGLARREAESIGNFWVDVTRSTLYVLLPLSGVVALVLVSQGVVQNFHSYQSAFGLSVGVTTITPDQAPEAGATQDRKNSFESMSPLPPAPLSNEARGDEVVQTLAMGPVASQVAIKQLGTNGGGFFNTNSAHPFENPTPLSNFVQLLAILVIPAALCWTFGDMIGDRRQGWAVLAAMLVIFVPLVIAVVAAEQAGLSRSVKVGVDQQASDMQSGGNLEGKEVRFGIVNSALWATATTAASNGSVNAMHDSFTPLGGLVQMWLIQLGEVVFGGVGSGLYGMLMFAIVAVFVAGLMVGRTPEYLGKKIEAFEMQMASIVILIPPLLVLIGTAIAISGPGLTFEADGTVHSNLNNPGAHGYSEVLYAFSSAGNNNGSAFAGLTANEPFYNVTLGIVMFVARYWLMIPVLAIAGSLAKKKFNPPSVGTLPTHTPLFVALLVGAVLLVGALTFVPALALGPVVEQLQMTAEM